MLLKQKKQEPKLFQYVERAIAYNPEILKVFKKRRRTKNVEMVFERYNDFVRMMNDTVLTENRYEMHMGWKKK